MRKRNFIFLLVLGVLTAVAAIAWQSQAALADTPEAAQSEGAFEGEDEMPEAGEEGSPVQMVIAVERDENGEQTSGTVTVNFEDPPEMPQAPADAMGLFQARNGDVLTLGGPPIEVEVDTEVINDRPPETVVGAAAGGDSFTVRLTPDTLYYRTETPRPEITDEVLAEGTMTITRAVEPGDASELGDNVVLRVWGDMSDGVLTADVVVYEHVR